MTARLAISKTGIPQADAAEGFASGHSSWGAGWIPTLYLLLSVHAFRHGVQTHLRILPRASSIGGHL